MKSTVARRLVVIVIVLAALAGVAAVAYHIGATNGNGPVFRGGPFRGGMMGWGYGSGFGLFWLIGLVIAGVLVFWLLAALLSPDSRTRGGSAGAVTPAPGDLDRLAQLSEMHTRGELTDDEFTAAKRKLLGLQ
jgi:uncharacterized membrane protein